MGFSRSARIKTLLAIDTVFLFIELITGYAVGSLALVADSFHMLNDVMSLIVALYALKLAEQGTRSNKYSYGWQRAEILGALVNGVFLLALCFTIFLEALQRMFANPEVTQPKIVVVVGSLGLLSNIVGLFLFHEHGHSHGGHSHSHSGDSKAEQGHSASVTASSLKGRAKKQNGHLSVGAAHDHAEPNERSPLISSASSAKSQASGSASPKRTKALRVVGGAETPFADESNGEDEIQDELDELLVHPARTREAIVRQAYDAGFGSPRNSADTGFGHRRTLSIQSTINASNKNRKRSTSGASAKDQSRQSGHAHAEGEHEHNSEHDHDHEHGDDEHEHEHDEEHDHDHGAEGGHGHSHGNMNMRGVFLHVLGDALGNVGVIAAGLIIWLTKSPYRFYSDPVISFVITIIIFSSALPLVRSASFILLQGTPSHIPLEKVRSAILRIPNVISVHDLHIWSLSESKLVASMHILVKSHNEFAPCSNEVRKVLHRFGVHSTTIQPELLEDNGKAASIILSRQGSSEALAAAAAGGGANAFSLSSAVIGDLETEEAVGCTVQCVDDSCVDSACCPPGVVTLASKSNSSLRPPTPSNANGSGSGIGSGNGNGSGNSSNTGASYASVAAAPK